MATNLQQLELTVQNIEAKVDALCAHFNVQAANLNTKRKELDEAAAAFYAPGGKGYEMIHGKPKAKAEKQAEQAPAPAPEPTPEPQAVSAADAQEAGEKRPVGRPRKTEE